MSSSNLARTITSSRNRHFSPWNVFSALLLLPEEVSLNMARRVMESFGIGVFSASSLLEAEKILHNTRLDLALCDFEVPGAGDLSLLQASSRWRGLCIGLMPTARLDQSGHKRVQIRVPKPVNVDMLVRSLKAHCAAKNCRLPPYLACKTNFGNARASWLAAHPAPGERAQCEPDRPLPERRRAAASRCFGHPEPGPAGNLVGPACERQRSLVTQQRAGWDCFWAIGLPGNEEAAGAIECLASA